MSDFDTDTDSGDAVNVTVPFSSIGVVPEAVQLVNYGVATTSRQRTRRDVLSNIQLLWDRHATVMASSLGGILQDILNPPRTGTDINREYVDTRSKMRSVIDEDKKDFWRMSCSQLVRELRSLEFGVN